ncbi:MAG: cysteine hydrolase family protein [Candidatus Bathyarchaeota archaeon]
MEKCSVLVVDMLNDFVKGKLRCDRAVNIIPNIRRLLDVARKKGIPCIYVNDAHLPKVDKEFDLWGPHAVVGTWGAEVIDELKPQPSEYVIQKRRYSGFYQTSLELLLRELKIETLIITGILTDVCVQHTAYDAYLLGYNIIVPVECVETLSDEAQHWSLEYMKKCYRVNILNLKDLLERMERL